MNRQYIGARYVPKIYENSVDPSSMEWEANTAYEPLTEVTYRYSSFISKKAVPNSIGNPSENPSYWAETGAYNGQIDSLQNQINVINEEISPLLHRKVVFLCDSYAAQLNGDGKNFIDLIKTALGLSDSYMFKINGIGFTTSPNSFLTLLQSSIASIDDTDSITDIVVLGGANDYDATYTTIDTAIKNFVTYAKTNFANAKISIGHVGTHRTSGVEIAKYSGKTIPAYKNCGAYGARYLTGTEVILHDPAKLQSDLLHPNNDGIAALASQVGNCLLGGRGHIRVASNAATFTADGTVFSQVAFTGQINERIFDDSVNLELQGTNIIMGLVLVNGFTSNISVKIGEFPNPLILDGGHKVSVDVGVAILDSSNALLDWTMGSIWIADNGDLMFDATLMTAATYASAAKLRVLGTGNGYIAAQDC